MPDIEVRPEDLEGATRLGFRKGKPIILVAHPGRLQPYTVWIGRRVVGFFATQAEMRRFTDAS